MLSGMAIPGDSVGEEDVEVASLDGYRTPPAFMSTSANSPPPFTGKRPESRSIKDME